jgi:hypothetical protein
LSFKTIIGIYNTYIIFKTNKAKNYQTHVNITKIPCLSEVKEAVQFLKKFINFSVIKLNIDNIIATFKFCRTLDLVKICEKKLFECMKYNNEEFPGLFVKKDIGTAILFHRGTIVLVGCNSKENLRKLALHVNEKLNSIEIF